MEETAITLHELLASRDARYCMRMRWHTQEEIWARINGMVERYADWERRRLASDT